MSKAKKTPWDNDRIQFARLIAEIEANGGFTKSLLSDLCVSMDLNHDDVCQIIDRAQTFWDKTKIKNLKKIFRRK